MNSEDIDKLGMPDSDNDFVLVNSSSDIEKKKYEKCLQASHCMIYSKSNSTVLDIYNSRALILMQFRFDGYLGFPGGIVDSGESAEEALNRELSEELGLPSSIKFTLEDRIFSHFNKYKSLLLHFFVKEVTIDTFKQMELISMNAPEYGNEVLGVLRVPLYTMTDGFRGFPAFLKNKFIGNSKHQLLESLRILKLMSSEEIEKAISSSPPAVKKNVAVI